MHRTQLSFSFTILVNCIFSFLSVFGLTIFFKLIGRDTLGEAVIALLYLVPVGWSATQWGQGAGVCAAVTAALAFDYFFIPPFYTFVVGRLEGWLVEVGIHPGKKPEPLLVKIPPAVKRCGVPDRILPILASPGMVGEIRIWR